MNHRFLVSLAAIAVLVVCAFSLGLRAQPGTPPHPRTIEDVDPGTPIYAGFGQGSGAADGFESIITLSAPGYYYLTQNLDVPSGFDGVHITSGGVHLDLRGFSIRGASGSGHGVYVTSPLKGNIIIRNGIITVMGSNGLDATYGRNVLIDKIASSANGGAGVVMYQGRMRDCISRGNQGAGFVIYQYSAIDSCSADTNGLQGFSAGGGNSFTGCSATGNSAVGLVTTSATVTGCTLMNNNGGGITITVGTVRDCSTNGNSLHGINAATGTVISGCTAAGSVTGIVAGAGCTVSNNVLINCSVGINVTGAGVRVEDNNIRGSATGISSTVAGSFVFGNTISSTTTAFTLNGTNFVGATINSAASITSTTSPSCNFVQ